MIMLIPFKQLNFRQKIERIFGLGHYKIDKEKLVQAAADIAHANAQKLN